MTMSRKIPCLKRTTDYSIFEMHKENRDIRSIVLLTESMSTFGFCPGCAIHVQPGKNGKLRVMRGHHRLDVAKDLGLPVWYIIDDTPIDIYRLEGSSNQAWSGGDFAIARRRGGDKYCRELLRFKEKNNLTLGASARLLGNGSGWTKGIKQGTFRVADTGHADKVAEVANFCFEQGLLFARSTAFVLALSSAMQIPEFDPDHFVAKVGLYPATMNRRGMLSDYLGEIEAVYNYHTRTNKQIPVALRADQESKRRRQTNLVQNVNAGA